MVSKKRSLEQGGQGEKGQAWQQTSSRVAGRRGGFAGHVAVGQLVRQQVDQVHKVLVVLLWVVGGQSVAHTVEGDSLGGDAVVRREAIGLGPCAGAAESALEARVLVGLLVVREVTAGALAHGSGDPTVGYSVLDPQALGCGRAVPSDHEILAREGRRRVHVPTSGIEPTAGCSSEAGSVILEVRAGVSAHGASQGIGHSGARGTVSAARLGRSVACFNFAVANSSRPGAIVC